MGDAAPGSLHKITPCISQYQGQAHPRGPCCCYQRPNKAVWVAGAGGPGAGHPHSPVPAKLGVVLGDKDGDGAAGKAVHILN